MLGIAVLFFLGLWVVITVIAMRVGWKCGKHATTRFLGAFLGFMLTMGGFIVHWTIECYQIQETVPHLCETEAGITVYVTPEEWRKQVGGEWATLIPYNRSQQQRFERHHKIFGIKEFYAVAKYNHRIVLYSDSINVNQYIKGNNSIFFDESQNKILAERVYFSAGVGAWVAGGSYKSWLNNVQSCADEIKSDFYTLIEQYLIENTGEKINGKYVFDYAYLAETSQTKNPQNW